LKSQKLNKLLCCVEEEEEVDLICSMCNNSCLDISYCENQIMICDECISKIVKYAKKEIGNKRIDAY
jgi:hypothetical protein